MARTQEELETLIKRAQDAYYNGPETIMSDAQFDELWDELKQYYPSSELLDSVGNDHTEGFKKAKHLILMGSQNKANTIQDMNEFFTKVGNKAVIIQNKMDGISCELIYKNGVFIQAITRGDGIEGDDITVNVSKMQHVPKSIDTSFTGAVRGEILLSKGNKIAHFPKMKNCRNAASGTSKRLDGKGCEFLDIVCYDAQTVDGSNFFGTQEKLQTWLESQGFKVAPWRLYDKIDGGTAITVLNDTFSEDTRNAYEYDIDGLVFKQNDIDMTDIKNNIRPKTQIALKPARTSAMTEIVDIEWGVRNGTLTPVAIIKPVEMLGATVKRASLANVAQMEELGIEIGHTVELTRAGEIIPKVIRDITSGKGLDRYTRGQGQ